MSRYSNIISEDQFRRMLCRERKRSERSRKHLLLMLVDGKNAPRENSESILLQQIAAVFCAMIRETDLTGWFETDSVLGVIFTEFGNSDISSALKIIETKIKVGLQNAFKAKQLSQLLISFYAFPDRGNGNKPERMLDPALYPDLFEAEQRKKLSLMTKRAMDIVGSAVALVALSPVFLFLAIIIKLTSKGPVFFRQERVGQYGIPFVLLKFRSMQISTDTSIHEEYITDFIAGKAQPLPAKGNQQVAYKITNDPRVTLIGKIMRRTSLDELPQFWNALKGEMSLVGPRPPVLYEIRVYHIWHRRRLLEVKPGITGLWQVRGRSKTTFDEMVRLDLQYSKTWSPLLDLKILLQTPRAVFSGDGAY